MRKKSAKTDQAKISEISAPQLLQRGPSFVCLDLKEHTLEDYYT
jgi:hypothetical protein